VRFQAQAGAANNKKAWSRSAKSVDLGPYSLQVRVHKNGAGSANREKLFNSTSTGPGCLGAAAANVSQLALG
jgi:hypothetical protein